MKLNLFSDFRFTDLNGKTIPEDNTVWTDADILKKLMHLHPPSEESSTENNIVSESKTLSTNSRMESSTEKNATLSKFSSTNPPSGKSSTEKHATLSKTLSTYPPSEESSTEKPATLTKSLSTHPPLVEKLFVFPKINATLSKPLSTSSPPRVASLLQSLFAVDLFRR